jgi:hypothetical protein
MTVALDNQGTVDKFTVKNSEFNWLKYAIRSSTTSTTVSGINAVIENNKFENIANEAITIGTSSNVLSSYVISSNNSFRNVGNNYQGENIQISSVIKFNDNGCQSVNDYFDRQVSTQDGVYMYPWVSGNATVSSGAAYTKTIPASATTSILKIPFSSNNQLAIFNYTLSNTKMTKTGQLNMNISTATIATANVSDNYNYTENISNASLLLNFSTDISLTNTNYIKLICVNTDSVASTLEYNLTLLN